MKRAAIIILSIILCMPVIASAAAHRDIQFHWSADMVNTAVENGLLSGYTDGTFRPDDYLTREEAAASVYHFLKMKKTEKAEDSEADATEDSTIVILDVEYERWSAEAVRYFVGNGALTLSEEGNFYPASYITREEVCGLVYDYVTENFSPGEKTHTFTDTQNNKITDLADRNIVSGYADGGFCPQNFITRSEFAVIMTKIAGLDIIPLVRTLPDSNIIPTTYISQLYPVYAVVGCEPTSLLMGLKAKGYAVNVTLREFLDNMPKTVSNPAKGFVGSPYVADKTKKTRTTIYPPILAEYASQYGNVSDFSGRSVEAIRAEILDGNPVVAYCTMRWETPYYRYYDIEGETQWLLSNNHVILVCGYDMNTNRYYIADPYNENDTRNPYYYWIDGAIFEPIYNERRHALVVR